jgi:hypothetical protein
MLNTYLKRKLREITQFSKYIQYEMSPIFYSYYSSVLLLRFDIHR